MEVAVAKHCFTVKLLVGKDRHLLAKEPLHLPTLGYPASAAIEAFVHGFQGSATTRPSLYNSLELLFLENVLLTHNV
uniref:Uncharacterized protein n=1 Tax=Sphaerodactylus townsendi TaxID=933632 RepID=A0ACB8EQI1_9SAUR